MKSKLLALLLAPLVLLAADAAKNCGCSCCKGKDVCCCNTPAAADKPAADAGTAEKKPDGAKRHPVRGVIVEVQSDQSSLLVKHEEIPGFMPAMTMLFKVSAADLKAAPKGATITAQLIERDGDFWLEGVKPAK